MKLKKIFASLILFLAIANSSLKATEIEAEGTSTLCSKILYGIKADPVNAAVSVVSTAAIHAIYYGGYSSLSYNPLMTSVVLACSGTVGIMAGKGLKDLFNGAVGKAKVTIAEASMKESDPAHSVLISFAHSIYDGLIVKGGTTVAIASLASYLFYDSLQARSADIYSYCSAASYTEQAIMGSLLFAMHTPKIISDPKKVAFAGVSNAINLTKGLFGF